MSDPLAQFQVFDGHFHDMLPVEVGEDGGAPGDEEDAPPDARFLHVQVEGEEVEGEAGGEDLAIEPDDEAEHGAFEALEEVDGLEEDDVGAEGEGGDVEVVDAVGDDSGIIGEGAHHGLGERIEDHAASDHHEDSDFAGGLEGFLDAVGLVGPVVLASEGEDGDVEADGGQEDDLLDARGDAVGGDAFVTEHTDKPGDDEDADGNGDHVEAGGKALFGDVSVDLGGNQEGGGGIGPELGFGKLVEEVKHPEELDDNGGQGDALDTHGGNA